MEVVPDDKAKGLKTPVWDEYKKIVNAAEQKEVSYYDFVDYNNIQDLVFTARVILYRGEIVSCGCIIILC